MGAGWKGRKPVKSQRMSSLLLVMMLGNRIVEISISLIFLQFNIISEGLRLKGEGRAKRRGFFLENQT